MIINSKKSEKYGKTWAICIDFNQKEPSTTLFYHMFCENYTKMKFFMFLFLRCFKCTKVGNLSLSEAYF